MLTVNEIKEYFKLENSHAKKELGQNFLVSSEVRDTIVDSLNLEKDDILLEIGPGLGALTEKLVGKTYSFSVVEYDQKFVNYLSKLFDENDVKIYKNNIVKHKEFNYTKVIGNLPYYMSTEILEFVILKYENLKEAVFMVQDEFIKRITATEGKDYNVINIVLKYLFDIKRITNVKKDCFFPIPNCESVVFKITRNQEKELSFARKLMQMCKVLFHNRRKTILNNLNIIVKDKELTLKILKDNNLSENLRAENLKLEDFETLLNTLLQLKIMKL